jgi:hypothetical protein
VPGHRLWAGEAPDNVELSEAGRVAVLLCVERLAGCGGATVEIRFGPRRVVWDEFHEVPLGRRIDVWPYTFDRTSAAVRLFGHYSGCLLLL